MNSEKAILLEASKIKKSYFVNKSELKVLKGIDLRVYEGDLLCIMGASGGGKSTLLHILGTLDQPQEGQVLFRDQNISSLDADSLATFRNENMGFVFQFHQLMSEFTALENVMMPCLIGGLSKKRAREDALVFLKKLGIEARKDHYPTELSGGEQQRIAIARALVRRPKILFADEPTGNLDRANSLMIQELLFELHRKENLTVVVVSHDIDFAKKFPKKRLLVDGLWADENLARNTFSSSSLY